MIRRAIISVSDKTGLVKFAQALQEMGVEMISTGGTMAALKKAGVQVVPIASFTGSPEILGGRVKTLHPRVHSGILFRRDSEEHLDEMATHELKPIDMVVVNLYPFEDTVANPKSTPADIIENIDIGGPSLIRAAAKNYDGVAVLTSASEYTAVIAEMKECDGGLRLTTRKRLASDAFQLTHNYDGHIAGYFAREKASSDSTPQARSAQSLIMSFDHKSDLRYGENPHQTARFWENPTAEGPSLARAEILGGKELSYNNIADLDAALEALLDFERPFACILKHANPCGAAEADSLEDAYSRALATDPLSAFGSIIGLNKRVDLAAAEKLHETQFIECILAPGYSSEALALLKKKKNRRILALSEITNGRPVGEMCGKFVRGGLLRQSVDDRIITETDLTIVTKKKPKATEIRTLLFAWKVVKHTKSNAIVLADNCATVGIGMGQTSRVDSSFLAVRRAGERARGACLASDAFFPMADGLEVAAEAGVTAFIQPGGSKKDADVIAAADKAGVAMVFTGVRSFRH
ncbi:MAG: bifunctional phosphoribosylaminoimidazolecarboxamide formyltransferase/IMP cyclohydrolase [Candidatus Zixiibacteriota bacterium]